MSRALLRSALGLRAPISRLAAPAVPRATPSPFSPAAAAAAVAATTPALTSVRLFNQTAQHVEPSQDPAVLLSSNPASSSPRQQPPQQPQEAQQPAQPPRPLSPAVRALLPVLAAQPGHYIRIHIHGRPFLVTEGDSVRLPFRLRGVQTGDVLRLDKASVLGSRDLTLKGAPYVDERLFTCRAVVTGVESEPMRVMIKKKQRCRRKKHVKSKHRFTVLRICEVRVNGEVANEA
ncbi:hypothetical protein VTJ83DRAFT_1948 [Remersonia thermophila]|uniref:Large ribosomal subunit protein bL21m n=1 Tax=Remersonia thermophila TaxID=72144 RepID=A0ABR4DI99_9PEZI